LLRTRKTIVLGRLEPGFALGTFCTVAVICSFHIIILSRGFGTCTFPTFSVKPPLVQPGNIFVANESLAGVTTVLASNENTEITQGGGTPVQKNASGQVTAATMYSVDRSRALEITAVEAEKVCLDLLQLPECLALANAAVYLEACVHDMMTTSDVRNIEASRMAFREACQARATSRLTLGNEFDNNMVAHWMLTRYEVQGQYR
jgi:hypothetical protein